MSKVPTFYLPQPLASRWIEPLESVGFEVILDREEQYINSSKEVEIYCGGTVGWKGLKVALVPQPGFSTIRFLLGYIGQENAPLLDMVERILFASGAKASRSTPSIRCKKLYTSATEVLADGFPHLNHQASFAWDSKLPWYYKDKQASIKPIDYSGTIVSSDLAIDVYSGEVVEVSTHNSFRYIALDYKTSLFINHNRYDQLINDIEDVLVKQGAVLIEFSQI